MKILRSISARRTVLDYDRRLAHAAIAEEGDAGVGAALALMERHDPGDLAEAARLVAAHGRLSPEAFDRIVSAYDDYRHLRDMAWE